MNETQVSAYKNDTNDCMRFEAYEFGDGDDNPTDPLHLTREQKDRTVTVKFENTSSFEFEIGADVGCERYMQGIMYGGGECVGGGGRVFTFVLQASLLCA